MIYVMTPTSEQLMQVIELAATLPCDTQLALCGNEEMLLYLAALPHSKTLGIVAREVGEPATVSWSVSAEVDRLRASAALVRAATAEELSAVLRWQYSEPGCWTGALRALVGRSA